MRMHAHDDGNAPEGGADGTARFSAYPFLSTLLGHTCSDAPQRTAQAIRIVQFRTLQRLHLYGAATAARHEAATHHGIKYPTVRNYLMGAFPNFIREECGGLPAFIHADALHTFFTGEARNARCAFVLRTDETVLARARLCPCRCPNFSACCTLWWSSTTPSWRKTTPVGAHL